MDNQPVVKLISKPENMLRTIYTACRTCYSADSPINIYDKAVDEEKMLNLIEKVISSGHYSTIEHIQVSFAISNVSRACTHQFVRHRHVSFSQKSQRYVKEKGQFDYLTPPTIQKDEALTKKYNDLKISKDQLYTYMKNKYGTNELLDWVDKQLYPEYESVDVNSEEFVKYVNKTVFGKEDLSDPTESEKKAYQEKAKKQALQEHKAKDLQSRIETAEALCKAGVITKADFDKIKAEAEQEMQNLKESKKEPKEHKEKATKPTDDGDKKE